MVKKLLTMYQKRDFLIYHYYYYYYQPLSYQHLLSIYIKRFLL